MIHFIHLRSTYTYILLLRMDVPILRTTILTTKRHKPSDLATWHAQRLAIALSALHTLSCDGQLL